MYKSRESFILVVFLPQFSGVFVYTTDAAWFIHWSHGWIGWADRHVPWQLAPGLASSKSRCISCRSGLELSTVAHVSRAEGSECIQAILLVPFCTVCRVVITYTLKLSTQENLDLLNYHVHYSKASEGSNWLLELKLFSARKRSGPFDPQNYLVCSSSTKFTKFKTQKCVKFKRHNYAFANLGYIMRHGTDYQQQSAHLTLFRILRTNWKLTSSDGPFLNFSFISSAGTLELHSMLRRLRN